MLSSVYHSVHLPLPNLHSTLSLNANPLRRPPAKRRTRKETTHSINQIIQCPQHPRRNMFSRHPRHLDRRLLNPFPTFNIHQHILKEIQIMHRGESFSISILFIGKMLFGVRGGYDREVAPEGGFDFLVEVVAIRVGGRGLVSWMRMR